MAAEGVPLGSVECGRRDRPVSRGFASRALSTDAAASAWDDAGWGAPAGEPVRDAVPRTILGAQSIGALVPAVDLTGCVHSVFARACNVACDAGLVTIAAGAGAGPTTIALRRAPPDLRALFTVGEVVRAREGVLRSRRVAVMLGKVSVWHPPARRALLPPPAVAARLARAAMRLETRQLGSTVLESDGELLASLARALRGCESAMALRIARRLVGLGEGLTPAGDDFLVGWLAGLERLASSPARVAFLETVADALSAAAQRTTPLAAHLLRLAACGHHGEVLCRLRDAFLCEVRDDLFDAALAAALACGATSGADTAVGLLEAANGWWEQA